MHDHDLGLSHDLHTDVLQRRRALQWLAALGGTALAGSGCGGGGDATDTSASTASTSGSTTSATTGTTTNTSSTSSGAVIPEETAGPYPGDGSNSNLNALVLSGIVRSDIRASFAGATGVAEGVALTLRLRLVNTGGSCAALSGYAIYLWHCDREGRYSMYSSGITGENYLRGVQSTDANGEVAFTSIFPGCYDGRMPHVHFEIYRSANSATSYSNKLRTSQLAFPTVVCSTVYASSGYSSSAANFARMSFASDNVFSDGTSLQMATVTGSVAAGYVAELEVGLAA
jgi:protocatechuate 3,4-dioxygenase beta subunit